MDDNDGWLEEKRSAHLYRIIADFELGTPREVLFRSLAVEADNQAAIWARKSEGGPRAEYRPDLRTRIVGELVRARGPRAMRGILTAMKVRGLSVYSHAAPGHPTPTTIEDMASVRNAVEPLGPTRPAILRKDFIIDEYQVLEARVHGADSVLLIVASLDDTTLARLMERSRSLGMEPLVEVNSEEEMERALGAGAGVIGINNRELRSFQVDLGTTDRLAGLARGDVLLAALSGISTLEDVERFAAAGASAVLVGESLMVASDPAAKIRELRGVHDPAATR